MAKAGPAVPSEMYDENVIAWKPGVNRQAANKGAQSVSFYWKSKLDLALSKEEGRPRYTKKPYIRITQPGDRDNIINREAWLVEDPSESDMADNVRFSQEWAAFQAGGERQGPTGTPLSAWPALAAEQVDELKHFNIFTVEQLADLVDANASRFMGIRALQRLAKDYLEAAKDGAVVSKLHGELEDIRNTATAQSKQLADNAETIRQLREMLEAQQRGRDERAASFVDPEAIDPSKGDAPPDDVSPPPTGGSFLRPKKQK